MSITIAFGPTGRYLIDTPRKWDWSGAHPGMLKYKDIAKDILFASFGPNGSWIIGYTCNQPSGCEINPNWHDRHISASPNITQACGSVWQWLMAQDGISPNTYVSMDNAGNFFARSGCDYQFALPRITYPEINDMTSDKSTSTSAALGINGSGVAWQTPAGGLLRWGLDENYPSLYALLARRDLEGRREGSILYVSLNAFEKDQFFVLYENGEVRWQLSQRFAAKVNEFLNAYKIQPQASNSNALICAPSPQIPTGYYRPVPVAPPSSALIRRPPQQIAPTVPRFHGREMLDIAFGGMGAAAGIAQLGFQIASLCVIL